MRRALLCCTAIILGLVAVVVLSNAPDLHLFVDGWHSPEFTRMVGVGIIVEGALAALLAALCLGRAIIPLIPARTQCDTQMARTVSGSGGGGPVLPICGILFLLAAIGPFGQARFYSETLEVEEDLPAGARYSDEIIDSDRRHERAGRTFGVLWVVVGAALLATPLLLKSSIWQLGWRVNGVGCGIAIGGFLLSGLGAFACFVNGLMLEGARAEFAYAGYLGVLAGAIIAIIGSIVAVFRKIES
jgi:hypothetical protein